MPRLTHLLLSAGLLALTGATTAAIATGCGHSRPGEAPPMAPRPESDPANSPLPTTDPSLPNLDAGTQALPSKSPVAVTTVPVPDFQPDGDKARTAADAATTDGYSPPLPPIPDASLPDSRLEPR